MSARQVASLQRLAGNAAVSEAVAGAPVPAAARTPGGGPGATGRPLPASASGARRILGPAAEAVRVHDGPAAAGAAGTALAMTDAQGIHLGAGAPPPDSPEGHALLAHEAAHVVQQTKAADGGEVIGTPAAEHAADEAMLAAVSGGPIPTLQAASGPHYFEAGWHQATLTSAMASAGFTDQEQEDAYFANWCRDVSQAYVPAFVDIVGPSNVMTLLNVVAQMKFGRGVTAEQLGAYDPREHIDAPAGLLNRDVVEKDLQLPGRTGADGEPEVIRAPEVEDLSADNIVNLMAPDAAGLPAYMGNAKDYLVGEATGALQAGRTPAGLAHLGNFSHTVQDLFAHSNWVEIAVGKLIEDGDITIAADPSQPESLQSRAAAELQARADRGQPLIETYSADVRDAAGQVRPMLLTGTFSGSFGEAGWDTGVSLMHEAQHLLQQHSPFSPEGEIDAAWHDLTIELLQRLEETADGGVLGEIFVSSVEEVLGDSALTRSIDRILGGITGVTSGLEEGARSTLGEGILGDVASWGARQVHGAATSVSDWRAPLRSTTANIVDDVFSTVPWSGVVALHRDTIAALGRGWEQLKAGVAELPEAVRNLLLPRLVAAERKFKEAVREYGQAAWERAVELAMSGISENVEMVSVRDTAVSTKPAMFEQQLEALRRKAIEAIQQVGPDGGAEMIARLDSVPVADVVELCASAEFTALLAGLDDEQARRELTGTAERVSEVGERLAQLRALPEWALAGPSHSQVTKDHSTSPFFGAAFLMANTADNRLVGALAEAWSDRGGEMSDATPSPGSEGSFGALPGEGESARPDQHGAGISDIEARRRRQFLETRNRAAEALRLGHGEVALPARALGRVADRLLEVQLSRPVMGPPLAGLIALLREVGPGKSILGEVARVRRWLEEEGDTALSDATDQEARQRLYAEVRELLGQAEQTVRAVNEHCEPGESEAQHATHAGMHTDHETPEQHAQHAGVCTTGESVDQHAQHVAGTCSGETPADHASHAGNPDTQAHYGSQIDMLDRARGRDGQAVEVEGTSMDRAAVEARDASTEALTGGERLMAEIDRIFTHPYDSDWWRPALSGWARAHQSVLAQYILDRNRGEVQSHAH